jgi:hypothetical protein
MTKKQAAVVVLEPEAHDLVIISEHPGEGIEANFGALKAHLDGILANYVGAVVTEEYVPQAKKDRAYLNGLSASLEQRRKEVKQRYMAPVTAFEAKVAELVAPIREASTAIDTQVKAFEDRERADKRAELVKHYNDFAGALAEAVPFERIEDPKWTNKTCNLMTAFAEIEAGIERRVKDEATLTELNLPHAVEAKAEYFATLDLSRAIARSKEIDAQLEAAAKVEAAKVEAAAYRAEPEAVEPSSPPGAVEWTFTIRCTRAQLDAILATVKTMGLHGRVRS